MNYEGYEEAQKDLQAVIDAAYELYSSIRKFESRYAWNRASLVEGLAGTAVGCTKDDAAKIYQTLASIGHQFRD